MDIQVNTAEMRRIASNIDTKKNEILDIYNNKVKPILESSQDCLKVSGLSYDSVVSSFNNVFNTLNEQLSSLTDALTTKIIPKYEESSNAVASMFNNEFAEQMNSTLSVMNS